MKITELLKSRKYTISFEVFPPKTDSAIETVLPAIDEIASLRPSYMSVTYGAEAARENIRCRLPRRPKSGRACCSSPI